MDVTVHNSSSSSESVDAREQGERVYLMFETEKELRSRAHLKRLEVQKIKKTEIVVLHVGSHETPFVLDSGATCNIMCASEYEKMEHKPPLSRSSVDIFQWGGEPSSH